MKSIILYITVGGLLLTSCKKKFLEVPSKTALNTGIYFTSAADFDQAINGAYTPLRGSYNSVNYLLGETRSDNTTYVYNSSNRGGSGSELVVDFIEDNTNGNLPIKYNNNYAVIARVNQILSVIDNITFDVAKKNNIKGQALFLRAFSYFDLVQYFGQVPLHLTPATNIQQTALPLSTVDDLYKQIVADCQQAISSLPDRSTQEAGKPTNGTARMLLGNVYLVRKDWADAEPVLKAVSGYQLLPDYSDVFDPANKNNAESLFEIQYKDGTEGFASSFFYTFLPTPATAAEINVITGIPEVFRGDETFNTPTPDIIAAYEAGDKRKTASIANITVGGRSLPYIKKYDHLHTTTGRTNDDFPVYRYAETLLFLAEALNEGGKSAEALSYLNQVRRRAGLSNTTTTDQASLRGNIAHERQVELAFENKRWLELVRTGTAETVMKAYGARVKANPVAYYFPAGITPAPNAYTNINIIYPIPSSEQDLNPYF